MKQATLWRRWFLLLLAALLLVACNGEDEVDVEELDSPPEIALLVDGEPVAPFGDIGCWPEQDDGTVDTDAYEEITDICEDAAIPDFGDATFHRFPAGSEIRLALEEPIPERVDLVLSEPDDIFTVESAGESFIDGNILTWEPDVPPGDYILMALGFWPEVGGVTYYYPITLE